MLLKILGVSSWFGVSADCVISATQVVHHLGGRKTMRHYSNVTLTGKSTVFTKNRDTPVCRVGTAVSHQKPCYSY
jgi:hypothetical protein